MIAPTIVASEVSLLKVVALQRCRREYPSFIVNKALPYRSLLTGKLVHALQIEGRAINVSPTALRLMVRTIDID